MVDELKTNNPRKECYNCWRLIPEDAKFCPFCGFDQIEKSGFKLISEQKEVANAVDANNAVRQAPNAGVSGSFTPGSYQPPPQYSQNRADAAWAQTAGYRPAVLNKHTSWVDIARVIGAFGALVYLIALAIEIAAVYLYTEYIPSMAAYPQPFPFYFVIPPFPTVLINGVFSTGYYIVYPAIAVIATLCFIYLLKVSGHFRKEISFGYRGYAKSTLFLIAGLFMAYFFMSYILAIASEALGQTLPTPDFGALPNYMLIFDFVFAPVWEETVYRMMLIGIPLLIYAVATGERNNRKVWRFLTGGNIQINTPVMVLMLVSSTIFGVAHWSSGSGWGLWKIFPAFVAGLILSYLFIKKGLWASMLFHFSVDATGIVTSPANNNVILNSTFDGFFLIWVAIGLIFFIYWVLVIYGFARRRNALPLSVSLRYAANTVSAESENSPPVMRNAASSDQGKSGISGEKERVAPYPVNQYSGQNPGGVQRLRGSQDEHNMGQFGGLFQGYSGEPAFGYSCSNCGGLEAKYENGKFVCVYCGHESDK
jgi:RNA polymerase subunit RPABC4/transcription elongation factor Spt4